MNNKGFTIVELIVTFVFISFISIELMSLVNGYRDKQLISESRKEDTLYSTTILKAIEDDINLYTLKSVEVISNEELDDNGKSVLEGYDRGLELNFNNTNNENNAKKLLVKTKYNDNDVFYYSEIKYGGVVYKAPSKFITLTNDNLFYDSEKVEDKILNKIIVGIYDDNINESFDFTIIAVSNE